MAIVTDWQKPLEESIEAILRNPDATIKDLEEVRRALSMLCEGESVKALFAKVDEVYRQRIVSFRDAADKIKNGKTREEVQDAMNEIRSLDVFEDKTEILRLGEERLEAFRVQEQNEAKAKEIRRKKRKRNIAITAVACVFAVVLACVFFVKRREAEFDKMKEQLQILIDEGNTAEIMEQLNKMENYYATNDELYSSYETVLEDVAGKHGFKTAFALQDMLISEDSSLKWNNRLTFTDWSVEQLNDPALSGEDNWEIARYCLGQEHLSSTDSNVIDAFNACFRMIVEEVEQDKADSLTYTKDWVQDNQSYLVSVPVDPDLALRLCYSLESRGMDLKAFFPDGIAVNIPLGSSISAFNEYAKDDATDDIPPAPDMSKLLPVAVVESTSNDTGTQIYDLKYDNEWMLNNSIQSLQKKDSHYTILLLPEYLMKIPEEMRAGSFEECSAVVAMQQLWIMSGNTYIMTSRTIGDFSLPSGIGNYRGYYMALDSAIIYDLSASDRFWSCEGKGHDAKINDDGWFELHKSDPGLFTADYMLGKHDPVWLKEKYEETIDSLRFYKFFASLSDGQQTTGVDIQTEDSSNPV